MAKKDTPLPDIQPYSVLKAYIGSQHQVIARVSIDLQNAEKTRNLPENKNKLPAFDKLIADKKKDLAAQTDMLAGLQKQMDDRIALDKKRLNKLLITLKARAQTPDIVTRIATVTEMLKELK